MHSKLRFILFIVFIFLYHIPFAQSGNKKIDSLVSVAKIAPNDTNKVLLLAEVSIQYSLSDLSNTRKYAEQALQLAQKLKYDYGMLKSYNLIGRSYALQSNYSLALKNYQSALSIAQRQGNPSRIAIISMSIGSIYTENKDYAKAFKYLTIAKDAYDKAGMPYATALYTNWGVYYAKQEKYTEAVGWYTRGIEAEEKKGNPNAELAILYSNTAGEYIFLNNIPKALYYITRRLRLTRR